MDTSDFFIACIQGNLLSINEGLKTIGIEKKNFIGKTALQLAVESGHYSICVHLIENYNATVSFNVLKAAIVHSGYIPSDSRSQTLPISVYPRRGYIKIFTYLMTVVKTLQYSEGKILVSLIINRNDLELFSIFFSNKEVSKSFLSIKTLTLACYKNAVDMVELLLRLDPTLNVNDHTECNILGENLLSIACDNCSIKLCKILLSNGAFVKTSLLSNMKEKLNKKTGNERHIYEEIYKLLVDRHGVDMIYINHKPNINVENSPQFSKCSCGFF
jgi:ankyrin repeat protein